MELGALSHFGDQPTGPRRGRSRFVRDGTSYESIWWLNRSITPSFSSNLNRVNPDVGRAHRAQEAKSRPRWRPIQSRKASSPLFIYLDISSEISPDRASCRMTCPVAHASSRWSSPRWRAPASSAPPPASHRDRAHGSHGHAGASAETPHP